MGMPIVSFEAKDDDGEFVVEVQQDTGGFYVYCLEGGEYENEPYGKFPNERQGSIVAAIAHAKMVARLGRRAASRLL